MLNVSNFLSFLRGPTAFLFLMDSIPLRIFAVCIAMLTDSLDGYLARKTNKTTQFGAIFDPVMDKFFVFFALSILLFENRIEVWQACSMISRDFFLIAFGIYLGLSGHWHAYQCKAIRWGKISTTLQFFMLIELTLGIFFPWYIFVLFILSGLLAFIELCQIKSSAKKAQP